MSHSIPEDVQRLVSRLRMLAEEIESAARFGVPIPSYVSAGGHEFNGVSFAASEHEFAAWADYTEADVLEYDHAGAHWSSATVNVNGLPLTFSVKHDVVAVAS